MRKMTVDTGSFPVKIGHDTSKRFNPMKPKGPGADIKMKTGKFPVTIWNDKSKRFTPPK